MKEIIFLILITFSLSLSDKKLKEGGLVKMRNCGTFGYFQIDTMNAHPSQVIKGDTLLTTVTGTAKTSVEIFDMDIRVTLDGIEIFSEVVPYYRYIQQMDHLDYEYEYEIPTTEKPGSWNINIQLKSIDGKQVTCTDTYFDLDY